MSRYYGMHVEIKGADSGRLQSVKKAASSEWPFADWEYGDPILWSYAEGNLAGGETEHEFTDRLAGAIWKANRAYCEVVLDATYLEELPHETHVRTEENYSAWLTKNRERRS